MRTTTRTRRLRVTVHPGGRVVVSRPRFVSDRRVAHFLKEHEDWLSREVARMKEVAPQPARLVGPRSEYLREKERARALLLERLAHFAPLYGLTYHRVSIKNMASRWGSCSAKGNLNFHYRVIELSPALLDYLVVHELCHRKEMNHGPHFWELVSQQIPDYTSLRTRLRTLYR
jgi:predicted metal-dependent hydrolase